jgi:hypothetical protein
VVPSQTCATTQGAIKASSFLPHCLYSFYPSLTHHQTQSIPFINHSPLPTSICKKKQADIRNTNPVAFMHPPKSRFLLLIAPETTFPYPVSYAFPVGSKLLPFRRLCCYATSPKSLSVEVQIGSSSNWIISFLTATDFISDFQLL